MVPDAPPPGVEALEDRGGAAPRSRRQFGYAAGSRQGSQAHAVQ